MGWDQVLAQVGVAGAAVAAFAWVARSWITSSFEKGIETHKAQLRREVDVAIERLRLHDPARTEVHKRLFVSSGSELTQKILLVICERQPRR